MLQSSSLVPVPHPSCVIAPVGGVTFRVHASFPPPHALVHGVVSTHGPYVHSLQLGGAVPVHGRVSTSTGHAAPPFCGAVTTAYVWVTTSAWGRAAS